MFVTEEKKKENLKIWKMEEDKLMRQATTLVLASFVSHLLSQPTFLYQSIYYQKKKKPTKTHSL